MEKVPVWKCRAIKDLSLDSSKTDTTYLWGDLLFNLSEDNLEAIDEILKANDYEELLASSRKLILRKTRTFDETHILNVIQTFFPNGENTPLTKEDMLNTLCGISRVPILEFYKNLKSEQQKPIKNLSDRGAFYQHSIMKDQANDNLIKVFNSEYTNTSQIDPSLQYFCWKGIYFPLTAESIFEIIKHKELKNIDVSEVVKPKNLEYIDIKTYGGDTIQELLYILALRARDDSISETCSYLVGYMIQKDGFEYTKDAYYVVGELNNFIFNDDISLLNDAISGNNDKFVYLYEKVKTFTEYGEFWSHFEGIKIPKAGGGSWKEFSKIIEIPKECIDYYNDYTPEKKGNIKTIKDLLNLYTGNNKIYSCSEEKISADLCYFSYNGILFPLRDTVIKQLIFDGIESFKIYNNVIFRANMEAISVANDPKENTRKFLTELSEALGNDCIGVLCKDLLHMYIAKSDSNINSYLELENGQKYFFDKKNACVFKNILSVDFYDLFVPLYKSDFLKNVKDMSTVVSNLLQNTKDITADALTYENVMVPENLSLTRKFFIWDYLYKVTVGEKIYVINYKKEHMDKVGDDSYFTSVFTPKNIENLTGQYDRDVLTIIKGMLDEAKEATVDGNKLTAEEKTYTL